MYRYIVNRVLLVIPTLIGAAALVFVLMRLIPGDICVVRLSSGGGSVDPRAVAVCHAELGLDRPLILQFLDFVWGFLRLDFGISMWSGKPVAEEIAARLPISLEIAVVATVVAILIAIPLGTVSALKQNSWIDHVVRTVAIAGIATPSFWLGIVSLLAILSISHAVFGAPWMPPIDYVPFWQDPLHNLSVAILPALTVGYRYSAVTMRMTRSAMLEVLRERPGRTADRQSARAQERAAAGRHLDRPRVRLPDRRARGDRAGVQHQRGRPPARAGDPESGLYLDAGPGHAHRRDLRARQSGGRLALCMARSAHPLRLTGLAPWSISRPSLLRPPLLRRRARVRCAAASSASAAVSRSARLAW